MAKIKVTRGFHKAAGMAQAKAFMSDALRFGSIDCEVYASGVWAVGDLEIDIKNHKITDIGRKYVRAGTGRFAPTEASIVKVTVTFEGDAVE